MLALKYLKGVGVSKDLIEGFKLFKRAAEWGEVRAQYDLGVLYATGQGSQRDAVQAHLWFSLAASQGYRDSAAAVAHLERAMYTDQITEAHRLREQWKPRKRVRPKGMLDWEWLALSEGQTAP